MTAVDPTTPLVDIDPQWAWQPWEPSVTETWDVRRAALLFRRAGFCATDSMLRSAVKQSPQVVVDQMFRIGETSQTGLADFEADSKTLSAAVRASGDAKQLTTWWLHRMLHSPQPLIEKMTLFWHGHFATGADKVVDVELLLQQNQLLRTHALGSFRAMVHGISKDPAMLIYLDSVTNRKAQANENFARELMELFCLGEGNYTEVDVKQLARCFTGWEIRRRQFRFNPYQHDSGMKMLFGHEVQTGEAAVDLVLANRHLPFFIARKLFRFFVCDEPEPGEPLLEPLARQLAGDHLSISGVVRTILGSRLLLSDWSVGRKIRSPVEMAVGLLRTLEATTNLIQLSDRLREVGQAVFYPPSVKGWDGGRAWVNSSTLVARANLVHTVIRNANTRFAGGSIEQFAHSKGGGNAGSFIDWFSQVFLAVRLTDQQRNQLRTAVADKSTAQMSLESLSLLAALPQFHLA